MIDMAQTFNAGIYEIMDATNHDEKLAAAISLAGQIHAMTNDILWRNEILYPADYPILPENDLLTMADEFYQDMTAATIGLADSWIDFLANLLEMDRIEFRDKIPNYYFAKPIRDN